MRHSSSVPVCAAAAFLTLCFYHKTEGCQDLFNTQLRTGSVTTYHMCAAWRKSEGGRHIFKGEADCTTPGQRCHDFSWPDYTQQKRKWVYVPTEEFRHCFEGNSHWKIELHSSDFMLNLHSLQKFRDLTDI